MKLVPIFLMAFFSFMGFSFFATRPKRLARRCNSGEARRELTSLFFGRGEAHFYRFPRFNSKVFYILHAAALCRGRMKNPDLTRKLIRFLSATSVAAAVTVLAQPDSGTTNNQASHSRPQVIYHLPP